MKILRSEKITLLVCTIFLSTVLCAYISSAWATLVVQGITHTFITGVSRFKTGLFILWCICLLLAQLLLPSAHRLCKKERLFLLWAASVFLFLYAHVTFLRGFPLSFFETVTASCDGRNSVHHFFHSHLFKGGIAYTLEILGISLTGRGDIGVPFAQLLPTHILILIIVLGILFFVEISKAAFWEIGNAPRKACSLVPAHYTLLKSYFDGGPFAGEAIAAFLFCACAARKDDKKNLILCAMAILSFLVLSRFLTSEAFEYSKQISRAFFFFMGMYFLADGSRSMNVSIGILSLLSSFSLAIGFYWHHFANYFFTSIKDPIVIVSEYTQNKHRAQSVAHQGGFTLYESRFTGEYLVGSLFNYFNIPPGFWSVQIDGMTCSLRDDYIEKGELLFNTTVSLHHLQGEIVKDFEPVCNGHICSFTAKIRGCVNNEAQSAVAAALRESTKEAGCFLFRKMR